MLHAVGVEPTAVPLTRNVTRTDPLPGTCPVFPAGTNVHTAPSRLAWAPSTELTYSDSRGRVTTSFHCGTGTCPGLPIVTAAP